MDFSNPQVVKRFASNIEMQTQKKDYYSVNIGTIFAGLFFFLVHKLYMKKRKAKILWRNFCSHWF
jgi:hypothetical protein